MTISNPFRQTTHGPSAQGKFSRTLAGILPCLMFFVALLVPTSSVWAEDYADRTPGQRFLMEGKQAYERGHYTIARRHFLSAARWSDKLAQYNLGAMHYQGHGFDQDSARAWAWFKIAAERDYPLFIDVADQVWNELDEGQRERALSIYEDDLLGNYGDAVTVPRTVNQMRRNQRQSAGSRLGWGGGFLEVIEVHGNVSFDPASDGLLVHEGRRHRGDEYYSSQMWDFERVMQVESFLFDAETRGQVTLGDFHVIEDEHDGNIER